MQYSHLASLAAIALAASFAGCASAPPLSTDGARVRAIDVAAARSCRFVQTVQYTDRIHALGKDTTTMRAIGEANLRNLVGAAGANSYVLTKDESNWFLGTVAYTGEAYACP